MKLDALDHPKTMGLAAALGIELPTAIGHLELLWAFVGKKTPAGDIGKWDNGTIAMACMFRGDPDMFVNALLRCRLLESHKKHRLVVHDWSDHAQSWVRMKLKKMGLDFVTADPITEPIAMATAMPSVEASTRARVPSEAKPREGKPSQAAPMRTAEPTLIRATFETCQAEYPAGLHRGDHWMLAEREIGIRLEEGIAPELLIENTKLYRAQQEAQGTIGTESVMRPNNFYNGSGAWKGPFPLPGKKRRPGSPTPSEEWKPPE